MFGFRVQNISTPDTEIHDPCMISVQGFLLGRYKNYLSSAQPQFLKKERRTNGQKGAMFELSSIWVLNISTPDTAIHDSRYVQHLKHSDPLSMAYPCIVLFQGSLCLVSVTSRVIMFSTSDTATHDPSQLSKKSKAHSHEDKHSET
ncbi:hypothetical protein CEXT_371881 [Caerostris extrusa]|uniref:Uncharacterized protein n=1 Tax=Caerostris extrusa TaxID=172846 RepID=A0AAV4XRJ8_CAEEX|nr:hypothetical protein CEXT_371881 [Caerostris extrusa]